MIGHVRALALGLGLALAFARESSCGGGPEPSRSGTNAPCTRAKDCRSGLSCEKGVCTAPDGNDDHDGTTSGQSTTRDGGDGG